jgi:hypothetical protein
VQERPPLPLLLLALPELLELPLLELELLPLPVEEPELLELPLLELALLEDALLPLLEPPLPLADAPLLELPPSEPSETALLQAARASAGISQRSVRRMRASRAKYPKHLQLPCRQSSTRKSAA